VKQARQFQHALLAAIQSHQGDGLPGVVGEAPELQELSDAPAVELADLAMSTRT